MEYLPLWVEEDQPIPSLKMTSVLKNSVLWTVTSLGRKSVVLNLFSTTHPLSNRPLFQAPLTWNKLQKKMYFLVNLLVNFLCCRAFKGSLPLEIYGCPLGWRGPQLRTAGVNGMIIAIGWCIKAIYRIDAKQRNKITAQACSQVLRFEGENAVLGARVFVFMICLKQFFLGTKNFALRATSLQLHASCKCEASL